ncbi:hypothetical protein [Chryseobacterium profundimaris]|uniref:Uncharacterized protein n=1 Tax=Chryseobacterium profundimaris TaxID=1387275 RepID=A0ABY1NIG9_9FLAO|nr:hypothetical protein [Chryseobacterium profundimaris]SMP09734.1 hypothetical protein SAMN06264346_10295 [Chryseobacterium profundimaris]
MKSLTTYINEELEKSNQNPVQENTLSTENTEHFTENNDHQEAVQKGENI